MCVDGGAGTVARLGRVGNSSFGVLVPELPFRPGRFLCRIHFHLPSSELTSPPLFSGLVSRLPFSAWITSSDPETQYVLTQAANNH